MTRLLLPTRHGDANALHMRGDQFTKKLVRSFAVVTVSADSQINMDFDIQDLTFEEINALGAGVRAIYEQLRTLAAQRAPVSGHG